MVSDKARANEFLFHWAAIAIPLFFLISDLLKYPNQFSEEAARVLMEAKLINEGRVLYEDFWDWYQPMAYWVLTGIMAALQYTQSLVIQISRLTNGLPSLLTSKLIWLLDSSVAIPHALPLCILLASVTASIMLYFTFSQNLKDSRLLKPLVLAVVLTNYIQRFDFGDGQIIIISALAPYIVAWHLQSRSHCITLPRWIELTIDLCAGICICCNPLSILYFLTILLQRTPHFGDYLQRRITSLLVIPTLYFAFLWVYPSAEFHKNFWEWAIPFKIDAMVLTDPTLYAAGSCPKRVDFYILFSVAFLCGCIPNRNETLFRCLQGLILCGILTFLLEGQGFSKDLTVSVYASLSILLALADMLISWTQDYLNTDRVKWCLPAFFTPSLFAVLFVSLPATCYISHTLEKERTIQLNSEIQLIRQGSLTVETLIANSDARIVEFLVIGPAPPRTFQAIIYCNKRISTFLLCPRAFTLLAEISKWERPWLRELHKHLVEKTTASCFGSLNTPILLSQSRSPDFTDPVYDSFITKTQGFTENQSCEMLKRSNSGLNEFAGSPDNMRVFTSREKD